MVAVRVENIIASASIAQSLDLAQIAEDVDGAQYHADEHPSLVFHVDHPKTAVFLFADGKALVTGAKTREAVAKALQVISAKLKETKSELVKKYDIAVEHVIGSSELHKSLDLGMLAQSLWLEKIEYNPEQFPGIIYHMDNPPAVLLLFNSGKLVCTGKNKEDVSTALNTMTDKLLSVEPSNKNIMEEKKDA